jgi:hypothetical protein
MTHSLHLLGRVHNSKPYTSVVTMAKRLRLGRRYRRNLLEAAAAAAGAL